jgi:hypothetical protein
MITRFAILATMFTPILAIGALLWLASYRDRRREAALVSQIRLSDAIAAELGAVVAPVVRRPWRGSWEIRIAVPLDRPALVARILDVARAALDRMAMPGGYELVLTAQESARSASPRMTPGRAGGLTRLKVA